MERNDKICKSCNCKHRGKMNFKSKDDGVGRFCWLSFFYSSSYSKAFSVDEVPERCPYKLEHKVMGQDDSEE